jgi:hypothetical protein
VGRGEEERWALCAGAGGLWGEEGEEADRVRGHVGEGDYAGSD